MKRIFVMLAIVASTTACDTRGSGVKGLQVVQCVDSEANVVAASTVSSQWNYSYETALYRGDSGERFFPPMSTTCSVRAAN